MYNGLSAIDDELFLRIAEQKCSYQTPKLQKNRKGQCCSSVFTSGGRCVDWTDCMVPGPIFSSCQKHKDLNMTCAKEQTQPACFSSNFGLCDIGGAAALMLRVACWL